MPSQEEIYTRVATTIVEAINVDGEEVKPTATLQDDLGAESIDFLDIVFRLEREFGIKIPRGELFPESIFQGDPEFVQDVREAVERYLDRQRPELERAALALAKEASAAVESTAVLPVTEAGAAAPTSPVLQERSKTARRRRLSRERKLQQYQLVKQLHEQGVGVRQIARQLRIGRAGRSVAWCARRLSLNEPRVNPCQAFWIGMQPSSNAASRKAAARWRKSIENCWSKAARNPTRRFGAT